MYESHIAPHTSYSHRHRTESDPHPQGSLDRLRLTIRCTRPSYLRRNHQPELILHAQSCKQGSYQSRQRLLAGGLQCRPQSIRVALPELTALHLCFHTRKLD